MLTINKIADLVQGVVGSFTHDLTARSALHSKGLFYSTDPLKSIKLNKHGEWRTLDGRCYHELRSSHNVWTSIPSLINLNDYDKHETTVESLSWLTLSGTYTGTLLTADHVMCRSQWFNLAIPFCSMIRIPALFADRGQRHEHDYILLTHGVSKEDVTKIEEGLTHD